MQKVLSSRGCHLSCFFSDADFGNRVIDASETPAIFWSYYVDAGHKAIATVAIRLLSIPCSNTSVEREFSLISKTHTTERVRLSETTVKHLMLVKWYHLATRNDKSSAKKPKTNESEPDVIVVDEDTDEIEQELDQVINIYEEIVEDDVSAETVSSDPHVDHSY